MDPKQEVVKLNTEVEELKELVKKLTLENNELRRKNKDLKGDNVQLTHKLSKLEALLKSNVGFQTARGIYESVRPAQSEEKVYFKQRVNNVKGNDRADFGKEDMNFSKKRCSKMSPANSYGEGFYIKN